MPLDLTSATVNIDVTLDTHTSGSTVDVVVDGAGLLSSYLMLCPGQALPDGSTSGATTAPLSQVYIGTSVCFQHVIPNLPLGVKLDTLKLFSNSTEVPTVKGARGLASHRRTGSC